MDDGHPTRLSRRTALRHWIAGSASLTLLAIGGVFSIGTTEAAPSEQSGGPAPAQVPSSRPAASSGGAPSAPSTAASTSQGPTAATTQMCVLTPEQTEGPYDLDVELMRSDITEGKPGLPLRLDLTVLNATTCQPLPNATVEVWHCDALGEYSGFSAAQPMAQGEPPGSSSGNPTPGPGGNPPPGGPRPGGGPRPPGGPGGPGPAGSPGGPGGGVPMRHTPSNDLVFLRGGQISDATSNAVYTQEPYNQHTGRDTTNASDDIFQSGGQQGLLKLTSSGSGLAGALTLGVNV